MEPDPIVAEIREIRECLAARFNYDIEAMVEDARQRDAAGDREIVRLLPRRPAGDVANSRKPQPGLPPRGQLPSR
jgi:hypothetical protein